MRRFAPCFAGRLLALAAIAMLTHCGLANARPQPGDPAFGSGIWLEKLPEPIEGPQPEYTAGMARRGLEGTVVIQVLVGKDGRVRDTRVFQSVPGLDSAAVAAVRRWTFEPARSNGRPVTVWVAVPIRFPPQGPPPGAPGYRASGARLGEVWREPEFAAWSARLTAAADSAWTRSPLTIALEFAGGGECECESLAVQVTSTPERFDVAQVTVTREGFLDDSVRGDRLEFSLRREAGRWRIERAERSTRCWPGRGHETYGPGPCR